MPKLYNYHAKWKANMVKRSKYHAKWKAMAKCSKYHAKWQVQVPNCCQYKANGTRKESQKQSPKPEATKIQKLFYTHKRIAIRWHQSPTLKQDLRYLLYWLQRVSFPTFPPQELPLQISNGIHSLYSQNCFCNPCKTYKLMAMERERERYCKLD